MSTDLRRKEARALLHASARVCFYNFYRLTFGIHSPNETFIDARHLKVMAHALEGLRQGVTRRQIIAVPPRHGKSLMASVAWPAWLHGLDPALRIIAASYGDKLTKEFAYLYREVVLSATYKAIFPDTVFPDASQTWHHQRTSAGGYRFATSVGGAITGIGADFAVLDDLMKASDVTSDVEREKSYQWIKQSLTSRFSKPLEGGILCVQQRLHCDDLVGRLRDDGWDLLEMPGEAWRKQEFELGDGQAWTFMPGDLLFPERFDKAALNLLRQDMGEAVFEAQIMQRPMPPGGNLFKLKHFRRYKSLPSRRTVERVVQSWDLAFVDSTDSSFNVCTTWYIVDRSLYLVDVYRRRMEYFSLEREILRLRDQFDSDIGIIETSGPGGPLYNRLRMQDPLRWIDHSPSTGKFSRAQIQTPKVERGFVYLPESARWLETFENEIATFPSSKFDDQVDSMVQFLRSLDRLNRVTAGLRAYWNWPTERPF